MDTPERNELAKCFAEQTRIRLIKCLNELRGNKSELARKLNVSRSTLGRWISNQTVPKFVAYLGISNAFREMFPEEESHELF